MNAVQKTVNAAPCHRQLLHTVTTGFVAAGAVIAVMLAFSGERAISAQDKYTVQVPNGLSFSEFRGFEDWATISVSYAGELIEVILGNPTIDRGLPVRRSGQRQAVPRRLQ